MIRDEARERQTPADADEPTRAGGRPRWDPLLTADEERELAERIKRGDQAARSRLILANLRVVVEIARRFGGGKVPLDDLIQEGNLGLIRASADFDPTIHGCRFYRYAEVWIRAYIHRALIRDDSLIRVPQHVFVRRKQERQAVAAAGRDAGAGDGRAMPAIAAVEGEVVPLTDALVDDQGPEQEVARQEHRLLLELALRRLNPVEAWVLRERYGLGLPIPAERGWSGPAVRATGRDDPERRSEPAGRGRAYFHRSYLELGRDCGLSRHRIQQIEETAFEKLRHVLGPCLASAS